LRGAGLPAPLVPAVGLSLCCLAASFYHTDAHQLGAQRRVKDVAPRLVPRLAGAFVFLAICSALLPGLKLSSTLLASVVLLVAGAVLPLRVGSYSATASGGASERLLILGTSPLARKIAEEVQSAPTPQYRLVGLVEDHGPPDLPGVDAWAPEPLIHRLDEVDSLIGRLRPQRLVVALSERRGRLPVWGLLSSCATGLQVEDGIDFYERLTQKLAIESLSPSCLIFRGVLHKSRWQLAARRAFSVSLAMLGLVLTAPLLALVALLVKLDSPGPVFFIQERIGLGGRRFRLIKFRTMRGRAPEGDSVWCRDDRPRLTRLGRWLRDLHIDELPQFINVLRGDMDLVGPRPEMASNVQTMTEKIPYYGLRHTVRPGVTGWAQIRQGYSLSEAEVTEKMRYDLYYIKHLSIWFDLRILLATVPKVLGGRTA
jgi:exopolysaccharide biosynthesis polyprenyl glycosylphosphotransferase